MIATTASRVARLFLGLVLVAGVAVYGGFLEG